MKSSFLFFLAFLTTALALAAEIKTSFGVVSQEKVDAVLSSMLKVPVSLISSRRSFDPADIRALTNAPQKRIVYLLVNTVHSAKCDFVIIEDRAMVKISDCESETASIIFDNPIPFAKLGIGKEVYR